MIRLLSRYVAAFLLVLVLGGCSIQRATEAFRYLGDVGAGTGPSRLKEETASPIRQPIAYVVDGARYEADLYSPGGGVEATAVTILIPGVVREGKDDPRLVAFAGTLARSRFIVLVPDLPNLRQLNVSSEDAEVIANAVRHIAETCGVGKSGSVGIVAFSYAAGPALIAAVSDDTREAVRFVFAVGPYYDIEAFITYTTTGYFRPNSEAAWQYMTPDSYAKWVFAHANASGLNTLDDRRLLTEIAERKLDDDAADVENFAAALGAEGRAVYRLLTNTDPDNVSALIAKLPETVLSELRALNLAAHDMSKLQARLIFVHGRDDNLIPYTESQALVASASHAQSDLFLIDNLEHVTLGSGGLMDGYRLWRAAYTLLRERDRMPAPESCGASG